MRTKKEMGSKQLTPRQIGFAENLVNGTTITEAARRAGYSDKNLAQSGHQALKAIRLRMPELMDDFGLTERVLIEKYLVPLLSATVTRFFQHEGRVRQKREVADNDARLKALDIAFRLKGSYAPRDPNPSAPTGVEVIVVDIPRPERPATTLATPRLPPPEISSRATFRDRIVTPTSEEQISLDCITMPAPSTRAGFGW